MLRVSLLLCLIAGTAACGRLGLDRVGIGGGSVGAKRNTVEIDGARYRSRVTTGEDGRDFTITVTPAGNVGNAQSAGRYQATVYCLRNYGGSDTAWTAGPDVPPEEARVSDNTLTLAGRCIQR
ncbi:MAG: hypothetical protein QNJ44_01660 [Rhodobacter sp.]|nr:hypothetical protein [Rhodobacter sp.]